MSEKKFSVKRLAQDVAGDTVNGAVTGAAAAAFAPDPTGTTIMVGAGVGAAVGAIGGTVSNLWGVMTDDPIQEKPRFCSPALYNSVVGLSISTVLLFAVVLFGDAQISMRSALIVIVFISSFLSTASGFLIDDIVARREKRRYWESGDQSEAWR